MRVNKWVPLILIMLMTTSLLPGVVAAADSSAHNRYNVVIVLDASNSMNYTDPSGLRYEAISQFAGLLAESGNLLGGVVFSSAVSARYELLAADGAEAKARVTDMLASVDAEGYTNIGEAIDAAVSMIEAGGDPSLPSVIVFLSDGNTEMPTDEELEASYELKAEGIQRAREGNIPIYTVCLNANNKADVSEMEQISNATGGVFREVAVAEDLKDVFSAFYSLIYGTSAITLVDETFPANGILVTAFNVPGIGVEEVNIVINGSVSNISLLKPDLSEYDAGISTLSTFSLIKITDVTAGEWTLITEGVPGDQIKINMLYNTDLGIDISAEPAGDTLSPGDRLTVRAALTSGGIRAVSGDQYIGYAAELQVLDAYGEQTASVPMVVSGDSFEAGYSFDEGVYFYQIHVSGYYLEKTSDTVGPITVAALSGGSEEVSAPENRAPSAVEPRVEKNVYVWPVKGGSFSLDLTTLAEDAEDDVLNYKILSSSFIEDADYTTNGDMLTLDHFSLSKGAFSVRATDSGGLYCDIEVIVTVHNLGIMALLGLGAITLIVLAAMGISLYLALKKPFYGVISVQSYSNGAYRGTPRKPGRGRCKLSVFNLDNVGLDYSKSYFQATGQPFIYLITDMPVICNAQRATKIRIESGADVTVTVDEAAQKRLYIRFDSGMKGLPRGGSRRR